MNLAGFPRCFGYSELEHVLLLSLMCLKLIQSSFPVAFVAFAFVPETIRHLTDNHEHWKKAAEDWVRVNSTGYVYLYSRLQLRLWCHFFFFCLLYGAIYS